MGRVALVTGGTRGIGAAIATALKAAGYNVAANYGGNDDAAKAFNKETKIPVFKWDVGDYTACEQGIVSVENEVGPIEVLVNNAGISRDAMLQKMTHEQWSQVIRTNLDSLFNMTRPIINNMRERGFGRIINISSINGAAPAAPGHARRIVAREAHTAHDVDLEEALPLGVVDLESRAAPIDAEVVHQDVEVRHLVEHRLGAGGSGAVRDNADHVASARSARSASARHRQWPWCGR